MTKPLRIAIRLAGKHLNKFNNFLQSQPLLPTWLLVLSEMKDVTDKARSFDLIIASPEPAKSRTRIARFEFVPTIFVVDDFSQHLLPNLIGADVFRAAVFANDSPSTLTLAIATAASRGVWIPETVWKRLNYRRATEEAAALATLTAAESETFWLIARGMTNREIARARHVQPSTIKYHVDNIRGKTGARNRRALIALANQYWSKHIPNSRPGNG